MIYGARKKKEFLVDRNNPESIKALKDALDDDHYYNREVFRDISMKGQFDSDVICRPCSDERNWDIYCPLAQAVAADKPFAIICPKCQTNYMEFMKE